MPPSKGFMAKKIVSLKYFLKRKGFLERTGATHHECYRVESVKLKSVFIMILNPKELNQYQIIIKSQVSWSGDEEQAHKDWDALLEIINAAK